MKGFLNFALIVFILLVANACKKSAVKPVVVTPQPLMQYLNLKDSAITFGKGASFDLNNDGEKDVLFSTLLVGDPVEQKDKKQWFISTSLSSNLPVNSAERIPVMNHPDAIPVNNFSGYTWYNAASIVLVQKTITMMLPPYWEGDWKESSHRYIPVQIIKPDGLYNGWVEVSFNTATEKLILHRSAVSLEANKEVFAGK